MSRVTIVTGGSSGIGRATVERLLGAGGSVVAIDRRAGDLVVSPSLRVVEGDVTSTEINQEAVAIAERDFGGLDAVVLNAGVAASGDIVETPIEVFDRTWEVNVRAVLLGIRAAVPALRRRGAGRIAVTASTSGIAADPGMWPYNSAKAAVINLVRGAALDLARDDITVNAICPGPTETGMTAGI
ncbi:MAG: SDR family NAD(P)-dependent oxidoreductase, partial [Ilumatobacteraceae bacterium]